MRRLTPRTIVVGSSVSLLGLVASLLTGLPAAASLHPALTRYPYLTDSVQSSITVNWATDTTLGTAGSLAWGPAGGNCLQNTVVATKTSITVGTSAQYQWKAVMPVVPDTQYCYRVRLGSTDLLGSDPSPTFTSQVAKGSATPYSFAVLGDWGRVYDSTVNTDQSNVMQQIAASGARFAVMTGDTAYPNGSQQNYGDLSQTGADTSTIFGPSYWTVPGPSIPIFNVTGNHGFTNGSVQIVNWPEDNATATSGGTYKMEAYPSINGSTAKSYPSMWYAFDAGPARFYALTAAWADQNVGAGTVYTEDRDAHWLTGSQQYQWLKADLEAHPNALKFAFWHYPLYADSTGQPSDTALQGGAGTLQGLLDANNVAMVFNGHAHGYERNKPDSAGMISQVVGNGGADLGVVSGCQSFDAYAIGLNGSHCGAAPAGLTADHVFGFVKVTVSGRQVTVTPTDELGRTYDVQTYTFPGSEPDSTPPTAPTTVSATASSPSSVTVDWSGATDNIGVTGYRVYRDGASVPIVEQSGTSYTDTTVAPESTHYYQVTAIDAAGNTSVPSSPASVSTPGLAGATLTFAATADATVDSSQPATPLGTSSRLLVDNSPAANSLLKFTVTGATGCSVASAKLRLTVGSTTNDNSVYGGDVYASTNDWSESTVTYNTSPATVGPKISSVATAVNLNGTYLFDVTPLVTGNGTVTILLKSSNSDGARYLSREAGTAATAPQLQVTCGAGPDTTAPSAPSTLTADAESATEVALAWPAATDNVKVTAYKLYRDGVLRDTVNAVDGLANYSYTDDSVSPSTRYGYAVSAVDASGNESAKATASVSTPGLAGATLTFAATADATVDSSQPATPLGTSSRLLVDNSPAANSLLKFTVSGATGCSVASAKLRLTVGSTTNDNSVYGGDVYASTNDWSESTVTYNTSPATVGPKISSVATAVNLNGTYLFDVTPLVTGNGTVTILLKSSNSDGARYLSREAGTAATAPHLQVTCG